MSRISAAGRLAFEHQSRLWVLAVLFYGVGDAVTTLIGLQATGSREIGPVVLVAMDHWGIPGFLAIKAGFISLCFLVWVLVSTPGRVAIPLALAVVGVGITCWNLLVIAA